ncbi:HNH endonuclease family protein [Ulvibacterium marinum]|uniref:HNH endonuclease n=1 Tax=Ulvibacterium marinum TaxID=2419782 RepID=A0A3B0C6D1_9FLAO|nr:hypothetical protein [Ulvibacterium marinum]RKN79784.1 hypothetical protein D7Z94_16010 [Ulvibacterium marinum]
MLQFKRPRRPNGLKQRSKEQLQALGLPNNNGWPDFKDKFWQDLKPHFMKAQHQKCGYCEIQVSAHGDVEHYRPKSELQELVAEGTELANSRKLKGRKIPAITEKGYWWLAYEWENYLLSCAICNQKYKSALFPIAPKRKARNHGVFKAEDPKKTDVRKEKPLLINPFEKDLDPYEHFEFLRSGVIKARNNDPRGKETIRVCGLRRISLSRQRGPRAVQIWDDSLDFLLAEDDSNEQRRLATGLYFSGHEINLYAGMVRIIFKQITFLEWSDLKNLIDQKGWMPIVEERVKFATQFQE